MVYGGRTILLCGLILLVSQAMARRQLIVVSVPGGEHASYYKDQLDGTLDPVINMFVQYSTQAAAGGDDFMVIYAAEEANLLQAAQFHEDTMFLQLVHPLDLWMRDFTSTIPDLQIKFVYRPDYMAARDARMNERDFFRLFRVNMPFLFPRDHRSNLVLDGGNVVDNGVDKVVITKRALYDNDMTAEQFVTWLQDDLTSMGANKEICLLEDYGDTTGHVDGRVAFLDQDTILVCDYGLGGFDQDKNALKEAFGEDTLDIVKLACSEPGTKRVSKKTKQRQKNVFDSALGAYVNMLVSDAAVYVPQFGSDNEDQVAIATVQANTQKHVLGVNTGQLAHMGGNVRCMSWQLYTDTKIASALKGVAFKKYMKGSQTKTNNSPQISVLLEKILKELENTVD